MMILRFLVVFLATTASGQNSVGVPCLGKIVDREGFVRELCGVSGSFFLGAPSKQKAISAGFSRTGAWVKTETSMLIVDGDSRLETKAPEGPALFTFRANGSPEFVYFQATNELFEWDGSKLLKREFGDAFQETGGIAMRLPDQRMVTYSEGAIHIGDLAFPLDRVPEAMEWINPEWIHFRGAALRITPGREAVFILPESN